ncbi:hypothetical protein [Fuchsiella alkaliacetigena]|uniref:hypothetical protein n=1 Tax=Fuchsiella alkaliacetigena TaxID=957042 RepID=UPI002009F673|nr:hypothetical protein [Fuchsiella alkaliacetigena]MCK8825832.1 hypothetical protein [Fuchsiella alkaliacetigena]
MKRLIILLVVILLGIMIVGGTVLAEEELRVEITDGEIEFNTTIFSINRRELDAWDGRESTREFLNIDGGNRELEVEFIGKIMNSVDWKLAVEEEDGVYDFSLAFAKELDDSALELAFWDGVHNITLKGRRRIGNAEGQTVIANGGGWGYVDDQDTYIRYYLSDEFNLSFKPFEADFKIGDEFEDELDNNPGIEANYQLSELMTLSGSFWTVGESITDQFGNDGADPSSRDIQVKGALDYEEEDTSFTVGVLLDLTREEFANGNEESGALIGIGQWIPNNEQVGSVPGQAPRESLIVNILSEHKLADDLSLESEAKLGRGSYENEDTNEEGSLTDLGLYTKLTKELNDGVKIYSSYTLRRTSGDSDDGVTEFDLTRRAQTFNLGAEKPLEEGLILLGDISLTPSSVEMDGDIEEEHSFLAFELMTGLRYEF